MKIVYYVSGHGFGHISRSYPIIQEFLNRKVEVFLVTERKGFLDSIPENLFIREVSTDLGVYQKSSLEVDVDKTKKALIDFYKNYNNLYNSEKKYLNEIKPDFIISDSSSFPFLLAKELKIPAYFIGNFTWDF
ncbi:MAG: glycosyl transferase, partial [Leptospiraceae bacterium]|nr:glycosyl transferase [Leptospiraceae bacterium]